MADYVQTKDNVIADRIHTVMCGEADARCSRGELLHVTPGPCWCGSAMPALPKPAARKRSLTPAKLTGGAK